jgi:hypothetical protein
LISSRFADQSDPAANPQFRRRWVEPLWHRQQRRASAPLVAETVAQAAILHAARRIAAIERTTDLAASTGEVLR